MLTMPQVMMDNLATSQKRIHYKWYCYQFSILFAKMQDSNSNSCAGGDLCCIAGIVKSFARTLTALRSGINLLGIGVLEKMRPDTAGHEQTLSIVVAYAFGVK
jgi:hypothetical protein